MISLFYNVAIKTLCTRLCRTLAGVERTPLSRHLGEPLKIEFWRNFRHCASPADNKQWWMTMAVLWHHPPPAVPVLGDSYQYGTTFRRPFGSGSHVPMWHHHLPADSVPAWESRTNMAPPSIGLSRSFNFLHTYQNISAALNKLSWMNSKYIHILTD